MIPASQPSWGLNTILSSSSAVMVRREGDLLGLLPLDVDCGDAELPTGDRGTVANGLASESLGLLNKLCT